MHRDRKDLWSDSALWGVTLALFFAIVAVPTMLYFNWWQPFVR